MVPAILLPALAVPGLIASGGAAIGAVVGSRFTRNEVKSTGELTIGLPGKDLKISPFMVAGGALAAYLYFKK